jgi:hypothetical protein
MGGKTIREDDGFLARWSRRKRSSAAPQRDTVTPTTPADAAETIAPNLAAPSAGREADEALTEPPSLPPIDSLDAASDITPFLAPGVPAELTRRALRKAWESDPAIRDFIGLSENSWDFNAPDGVPGFGSLTPEEIRRLLDGVIGKPDSVDPPPDASEPATAELPPEPTGNAMPAETAAATPVVATRSEPDQEIPRAAVTGRRHGGALPR